MGIKGINFQGILGSCIKSNSCCSMKSSCFMPFQTPFHVRIQYIYAILRTNTKSP